MKLDVLKSGLVVPHQPKPAPPKRVYDAIELQDEDSRKKAFQALSDLWDALDLSNRR